MEPLPFIQIDDYEAFREIIPELPDTDAAWQEKHEQATRAPGEFQVVPVRPGEFMEYCRVHDKRHSEQSLWDFAHHHAGPHEAVHNYNPIDE